MFLNSRSVYESFGTSAQTDDVFLDFKKAFDGVAHNDLQVRLWYFGIIGDIWNGLGDTLLPECNV